MQSVFFFKIFGVPFFSYTTCIGVSVVVALLAAASQLQRERGDARWLAVSFAWLAAFAMLGGRVAHLLLNADYYRERPTQMLNFYDGGLSFVGVFIGGTFALWLSSRLARVPFARVTDVAALPTCIVACGAWLGAFMRGSEYGTIADNVFALELHDTYGVVDVRWATQVLAALWCALLGLLLMVINTRGRAGQSSSASAFIGLYALGLFWLDFTRGDATLYILGLRPTQWLYVVLIVASIFVIGRRLLSLLTNPRKTNRI